MNHTANVRDPGRSSRVRARTGSGQNRTKKPTAGAERLFQLSAVLADVLSFEQQVSEVLQAARDAVGIDRIVVWAVAPEGERLVCVATSGLSKAEASSLAKQAQIALAESGAMGKAYRSKTPLLVSKQNPLPPKLRLRP